MNRPALAGVAGMVILLAIALGVLALAVKALKWLLIVAVLTLLVGMVIGWAGARRRRS